MKTLLAFLISFVATYFSMPIFRAIAVRFDILDIPGGRKIHKIATPLLGGVAVYFGLIIGVFFNLTKLHFFMPLLIGATLILILGLINDIKPLSARFRFLCQVIISLFVIKMGLQINFLPYSLGVWKYILEVVITIIWLVGVTNAYNYLDGLDGLAAGSAAINLICFGVILYKSSQYPLGLLAVILIATCFAFLPYNFHKGKYKIFLGEAGSTMLGFILAGFALSGFWAEHNIARITIPVLILGVPIFDMVFTTVMRIKEGKVKSVYEWLHYSGKDHFHHILVDLGFTQRETTLFIYVITFSLGLSAIMVSNDSSLDALMSLTQAAVIFTVVANLIIVGKKRRSGWNIKE
ncbi:MAG: MraY family glycosyltransferase [Candidatus Omnitrophica bacterium]|nr:MraY family glycosyltransferase [Candidatus Omnitrophota bacterium]